MLQIGAGGVDVQAAELRRAGLRPAHSAQLLLRDGGLHPLRDPGDLRLGRDDLQIHDLLGLEDLALQIAAVGRAPHALIDDLLLGADLTLVEDAGLVVVDGVDEIADAQPVELRHHGGGGLRRQRLGLQIGVLVRVIDRRAVHHDHGRVQLRRAHLQHEERRRVLAHQTDPRAVVVEIVQPEQRRRRDVGEAVGREILRAQEKHQIAVFVPRQAEHVHRRRHHGADHHVQDAVTGLLQRRVDVGKRDHDAQKHDRREPRGVRRAQQHGRVERQQHACRHHRVQAYADRAERGEHQQHQQQRQRPDDADQRAEKAVLGVLAHLLHVGLHAHDRRDRGLGGHVLPGIAAQRVDHQTEEHRDRRLDDALAQMRQPEALRRVHVLVELLKPKLFQSITPFQPRSAAGAAPRAWRRR